MLACFDLDDTITADPEFYRAEMRGLRAQGHQVHILTGTHTAEVTSQEVAQKLTLLGELGFVRGREYDEAVAVPGPESAVPANKVAYMKAVGASHLVDDRKANCKAARKAGFTAHHHMHPKGQ
jgi:hypothetical protein